MMILIPIRCERILPRIASSIKKGRAVTDPAPNGITHNEYLTYT